MVHQVGCLTSTTRRKNPSREIRSCDLDLRYDRENERII